MTIHATHLTEAATERGATWLSTAGLRPTRQRIALATLLVGDGCNRHVTAESLFDAATRSVVVASATLGAVVGVFGIVFGVGAVSAMGAAMA